MASMGVFEMFISEFNIPKYVYNTCTFQNIIMNGFDKCNTTKTIIKCICFVYCNIPSQMYVTIHQPFRTFSKYEIAHLEEVLLEFQQAVITSKYK